MRSGGYNSCVDGHGFIFDSLSQHNYTQQVIIEQCMMLGNALHGIHVFKSYLTNSRVFNCTLYGNNASTVSGAPGGGEVNMAESSGVTFDKNIMQSIYATRPGVSSVKGSAMSANAYGLTAGFSGSSTVLTNNDYIGINGQNFCDYSDAYPGCNPASQYRPTFGAGNLNVDPQFVNPTIPTTAPDCSAATTVTGCLSSLIAGFTPQNSSVLAAGMGYKPPAACAPDPYWPTWVPVSLVPNGLVTKPCS
jgi:hypothetical protein